MARRYSPRRPSGSHMFWLSVSTISVSCHHSLLISWLRVARGCLRIGLRFVGILARPQQGWSADGPDGLHVEPEPVERPHHESPVGQFVLERRVVLGAAAGGDDYAVFL